MNKVYGDFIAYNISGDGKVFCKCCICGKEIVKDSMPSVYEVCKHHPHKNGWKNKIYNNLKIIRYEYKYRDLEYFTCKCEICGKTDILNVKQMLEHKCKEG